MTTIDSQKSDFANSPQVSTPKVSSPKVSSSRVLALAMVWPTVFSSTVISGCAFDFADAAISSSGDFGATVGGVKDMKLARALVAEGNIPPPEAFLVEGMFAEHDLPLDGDPCNEIFCLRAAAGTAPTLQNAEAGWVQLALSSNINPNTYTRPNAALIAVVDVSGSMGFGYGDHGTPGEMSRAVLEQIGAQLTRDDVFAMVTYGSNSQVALEPVRGDEQNTIQARIADLHEDGSTNMEAGMRVAFDLAQRIKNEHPELDDVRALLFTDAQPNVGITDSNSFSAMAAQAADNGVSLTVFGMGLGLGQELVTEMSKLRGGNSFSVITPDDVDTVLDENWPYLVSPIAYNLHVSATLPAEPRFVVGASYGFPGTDPQERAIDAASVFLSKRRGALLLRVDREDAGDDDALSTSSPKDAFSLDMSLSYRTRDGEEHTATLSTQHQLDATHTIDARGHFFAQNSTAKATALAILVESLKTATTLYNNDPVAAEELARLATERIEADAAAYGEDLQSEAVFARALLDLIVARAPMGNLYGGF